MIIRKLGQEAFQEMWTNFEVLEAVIMKIPIFSGVMQCNSEIVVRFGGTYRLVSELHCVTIQKSVKGTAIPVTGRGGS
jgi:hypothetical protein